MILRSQDGQRRSESVGLYRRDAHELSGSGDAPCRELQMVESGRGLGALYFKSGLQSTANSADKVSIARFGRVGKMD